MCLIIYTILHGHNLPVNMLLFDPIISSRLLLLVIIMAVALIAGLFFNYILDFRTAKIMNVGPRQLDPIPREFTTISHFDLPPSYESIMRENQSIQSNDSIDVRETEV